MYRGTIKSKLSVYLSNLLGWRTNQKIIVIECDDWGSIYIPDKRALEALKSKGIPLKNHFIKNDTLESNEDLEMLFDVLQKHKDASGRSVVMTGVNVVANPDFEKIKANGFSRYEYELFNKTAQRFPGSDKIYDLWKDGINHRLLVPVFHGREHVNVKRWMKLLRERNEAVRFAFDYGVSTLIEDDKNNILPDTRAAFEIDDENEIIDLSEVITTGLKAFKELFGYHSTYFIPTNGYYNNALEKVLSNEGVKYIGTSKIHNESLGNGIYRKQIRYIGKKNQLGQTFLTRNSFFEPTSWKHPYNGDSVGACLKEIEIAFRCRKPATIATHRANFVGTIDPENRSVGLRKLDILLSEILKRWPDSIFLTSMELGDLIKT